MDMAVKDNSTESIYLESGFPKMEDDGDRQLKQFDYWDVTGFAAYYLEQVLSNPTEEEIIDIIKKLPKPIRLDVINSFCYKCGEIDCVCK